MNKNDVGDRFLDDAPKVTEVPLNLKYISQTTDVISFLESHVV